MGTTSNQASPSANGGHQQRAARLVVGSVLDGRYVLRSLIGVGGMGKVFAAHDLLTGRGVAVKSLRFEGREHDAKRFVTESRAMSAISHRAVVQVLDSGTLDGGVPYLVMELLEGTCLRTVLDRGRPSLAAATAVLAEVAAGVEAAHAAAVLHRDLKPENVFVHRPNGVAPGIKIVDFGIAKLLGAAVPEHSLTGTVLGTPGYMAPEQAFGTALDGRVDVYALGVIAYELIAGRHPFEGLRVQEFFPAMLAGRAPHLAALAPDCPAPLVAWVTRAMHVDRDRRFASSAAARDELHWAIGASRIRPDLGELPAPASRSAVALATTKLWSGELQRKIA